jgi:hypothetical protein
MGQAGRMVGQLVYSVALLDYCGVPPFAVYIIPRCIVIVCPVDKFDGLGLVQFSE